MRVLWLVRRNLRQHPGGDTTQILNTAEKLRQRGITIDFESSLPRNLHTYDLVHLFHLDRLWENERYCRKIRSQGCPVILSPIYWPTFEYDREARPGLQGFMARTFGNRCYQSARIVQRWLFGLVLECGYRSFHVPLFDFKRAALSVLRNISVLLPNSKAELRQIEAQFGIQLPSVVVPNAVDVDTFYASNGTQTDRRREVLCVGRIEPRKNQLNLIRALRSSGIPLVLVGHSGRFNYGYYRRCRREAGDNVRFVDYQNASQLRDFYRRAWVHACVSWYETPGLVNLEAALCGCAVVATPGGCTREYLGDQAYYCEAGDTESIRKAIGIAFDQGSSKELAQRVARHYTWQQAAEKTWTAYQLALKD